MVDLRQAGVGACAGFIEACIMHPVDTIKTRVQAQSVEGVQFKGVRDVFTRTLREESPRAFYKGFPAVLVSVVPRVCAQYQGLACFLPLVREHAPSQIPRSLHASIAGVLTGIVQASLIVAPLELLKNRSQVTRSHNARSGLFQVANDVIQRAGIRGLYQGLAATVLRQCWGLWIKFGCYVGICDLFRKDGKELTPVHYMLAGGTSNTFVGVLVSPLDVVKTRIQLANTPLSVRACVRGILQDEGWRVFFRGASMRVLRVAPGGAIQFATAEYFAKMMGVSIGR